MRWTYSTLFSSARDKDNLPACFKLLGHRVLFVGEDYIEGESLNGDIPEGAIAVE